MLPVGQEDNKAMFTHLIQKQIVVLGPQITLFKVKNIPGLEVNDKGEVTSFQGDPQEILKSLINQFVELSGLIVRKTMESILASSTGIGMAAQQAVAGGTSAQAQAPVTAAPVPVQPVAPAVAQTSQSQANPVATPIAVPADVSVNEQPATPPPANDMQSINKALDDLMKSAEAQGQAPEQAQPQSAPI